MKLKGKGSFTLFIMVTISMLLLPAIIGSNTQASSPHEGLSISSLYLYATQNADQSEILEVMEINYFVNKGSSPVENITLVLNDLLPDTLIFNVEGSSRSYTAVRSSENDETYYTINLYGEDIIDVNETQVVTVYYSSVMGTDDGYHFTKTASYDTTVNFVYVKPADGNSVLSEMNQSFSKNPRKEGFFLLHPPFSTKTGGEILFQLKEHEETGQPVQTNLTMNAIILVFTTVSLLAISFRIYSDDPIKPSPTPPPVQERKMVKKEIRTGPDPRSDGTKDVVKSIVGLKQDLISGRIDQKTYDQKEKELISTWIGKDGKRNTK